MHIKRPLSALLSTALLAGGGIVTTAAIPASGEEARPAAAGESHRSDYGVGRQGPMSVSEERRSDRVVAILAAFDGALEPHKTDLSSKGLEIVSEPAPAFGAESNNGDVSLPRPYVLFDRQARRYYATAKYNWRENDRQYFDSSRSCDAEDACKVGGQDGFGMRFNKKVVNRTVNAIFCGRGNTGRDFNKFGCFRPTNPAANSSAGVSYRAQDKVHRTVVKPDFNMYKGTITMSIKPIRCGRTLQIFSRYGHGYSSTSLTSFGLSNSGWNLSWSKSSARWEAASQSGTWKRC